MDQFSAPYNCIIADDDEVDRLTTVSFVRRYPFLNITGIFESTGQALQSPQTAAAQVMLLDIDMPGLNGLEFRRRMIEVPVCIFISSYTEHAMESFELAAFDFIQKPLTSERFAASMRRLEDFMDMKRKASLFEISLGSDIVYVKDGHDRIKLKTHEVLYLEALKDYTKIVTVEKEYCVISSIGTMLKAKFFEQFLRIHRSYAVQKHYIQKITATSVFVNDLEFPIGRSYKEIVRSIK